MCRKQGFTTPLRPIIALRPPQGVERGVVLVELALVCTLALIVISGVFSLIPYLNLYDEKLDMHATFQAAMSLPPPPVLYVDDQGTVQMRDLLTEVQPELHTMALRVKEIGSQGVDYCICLVEITFPNDVCGPAQAVWAYIDGGSATPDRCNNTLWSDPYGALPDGSCKDRLVDDTISRAIASNDCTPRFVLSLYVDMPELMDQCVRLEPGVI